MSDTVSDSVISHSHSALSDTQKHKNAIFFMVALCNRETIYIFMLFLLLLLLLLLFFSSPNLSGRRLDVYHTLAHGVALVRI